MKSRAIFICLLMFCCFGFMGCVWLESFLGEFLEGASAKTLDPYIYFVLPNDLNSEMVTLKMEYETNNKIVRDFECSEITDTELFELKENFQNSVMFGKTFSDSQKVYCFDCLSIDLETLKDFSCFLEFEIICESEETEKYSGNICFSDKLKSGSFSEHGMFKEFKLVSNLGKEIEGLFTYLLVMSI